STASFDSFSKEELYKNPWEDLINEKNPATYLTGVMTAEIEKDSITPNMNVNMMDIEEEDLPTEQKTFKAATNFFGDYIYNQVWKTIKPQLPLIAEYNLEPCQNFQCTSDGFTFDNIPKYNWSYVEFLSTKFGAREKGKNKYICNWCGPDAQ
ncbi:19765_t:CDS:2, partial [Gigaspora margarita]